MNLNQIHDRLPPTSGRSIDLQLALRDYRNSGGADNEDAFLHWLAQRQPELLDAQATLAIDTQVQVSQVLPPRLRGTQDATRVNADASVAIDSARTVAGATTLPETNSDPAASKSAAAHASGHDDKFHYEILRLAGQGGMGTVHVAKDTELMRHVALKQLNPEVRDAQGLRQRFVREVQITAQLDHPHIVPVYALELSPDGAPAYTMKLIEGITFHALLNETRDLCESDAPLDESHSLPGRLEHFLKVCDAIAYAHAKGVIHRDLKPANLMIGRHHEVYVMDWGLCRVLRQADENLPAASMPAATAEGSGSASDTQLGEVIGTPKYMSPEQAQGRNNELDARSDQYALGLILYELITLQSPYAGRTAYEVLVNAAAGQRRPIAPAYRKLPLPRELIAVIERATTIDRDRRYASVDDLAADIRRYLRGEAVLAQPDSVWQRMQRWVVRHRQGVLTSALGLFALAASAIGLLIWLNQSQLQAARDREQHLLRLRDVIGHQAGGVQTRFLQLEGAIENLSSSTELALQATASNTNRFYLLREFLDPKTAPPDLKPSAIGGGKFSFQYPVWTVPPGMNESVALPTVRNLSVLQPFRREIYQRAATMLKDNDSDMYNNALDSPKNDDSPIIAIVLGLENGIGSRYPGWDGLTRDYDPRVRPWYQLAHDKHGPQWGAPYRSSISAVSELPLSVPLFDDRQRFVGVVAALLQPDRVVSSLLKLDGVPGLRGEFLLDGEGRILVATGRAVRRQTELTDEASLQPFPIPALVARVKAGESGILETSALGDDDVIVFVAIDPLGWSLVAVADAKTLFAVDSPDK